MTIRRSAAQALPAHSPFFQSSAAGGHLGQCKRKMAQLLLLALPPPLPPPGKRGLVAGGGGGGYLGAWIPTLATAPPPPLPQPLTLGGSTLATAPPCTGSPPTSGPRELSRQQRSSGVTWRHFEGEWGRAWQCKRSRPPPPLPHAGNTSYSGAGRLCELRSRLPTLNNAAFGMGAPRQHKQGAASRATTMSS